MAITKWYEITCDTCGNAQHFQGNLCSAERQFRKAGGIVIKGKKTIHYCDDKCKPLPTRSETCESCGRDLPDSEYCEFCGHNNHRTLLSGGACKRIKEEIEAEKPVIV